MQTVFRVQNKDGKGPYVVGDFEIDLRKKLQKLLLHHNDEIESVSGTHPTPTNDPDIERFPKEVERCGFESMKQLNKWFTECELKWLKELGFGAVEVQGTITARGKYQVLFTCPETA